MIRSVFLLLIAECLAMSLWFSGAAVVPGLTASALVSEDEAALLTSLVQAGFVAGGLAFALTGFVDRFSPRGVFCLCALVATGANSLLLVMPPGDALVLAGRFLLGAALAGVYPVGMAIAASFGATNRGLLIGALVGALTFGSALPHGAAAIGFQDWRSVVGLTSLGAALAAVLILFVPVGAGHVKAVKLNAGAFKSVFHVRGVRTAFLGYFGHMWELYAFWAWIGSAIGLVFSLSQVPLITFCIVGIGAVSCVVGGVAADRVGKARVARWAMFGSAAAGLLTAGALYAGVPALVLIGALLWGFTVIPDSPQFSALVADHAPAGQAGSLLVLQTALGFALTALTVQGFPVAVEWLGWPGALSLLAAGPVVGVLVMGPLAHREKHVRRLDRD